MLHSKLAFLFTAFALILTFVAIILGFVAYENSIGFCKQFSAYLISETNNVKLEVGKGTLAKMSLKNTGFEDEFKISAEGPKWVVVRPDFLRLRAGEMQDVFVYMSPDIGVVGNFDIKIKADSFCAFDEEIIRVVV